MDTPMLKTAVINRQVYFCRVFKRDNDKFSGIVWDQRGATILETQDFDLPFDVWDALKCELGCEMFV